MGKKGLTCAMMFAKVYYNNEQEMKIDLITTSVIRIPNQKAPVELLAL